MLYYGVATDPGPYIQTWRKVELSFTFLNSHSDLCAHLEIQCFLSQVEVLFEELLRLHEPEPFGELPKFKSVHDVFAQSTYRTAEE